MTERYALRQRPSRSDLAASKGSMNGSNGHYNKGPLSTTSPSRSLGKQQSAAKSSASKVDDEDFETASYSHSHSHSHSQHAEEEAAALYSALSGSADPGSRITLIGMLGNITLVAAKGMGGLALNSNALLADAGHSASDLLCDFAVLFCWRLSRSSSSKPNKWSVVKYETVGSLLVALLLLSGGIGIAVHSYSSFDSDAATVLTEPVRATTSMASRVIGKLLHTHNHGHGHRSHAHAHVQPDDYMHIEASSKFDSLAATVTATAAKAAQTIAKAGHVCTHHEQAQDDATDPKAAAFAVGSVLVKEWLYRATLKIAKEEKSNLLLASAHHHRSDALSSLVALVAIIGSIFGLTFLDSVGGLVVSAMILHQGLALLKAAILELLATGKVRSKRE
ncbi:uncharacterized protein L969DRAFT_102526 [Mixia osmundae IAM 14324]|uniref:Cation efflux protein transmembrane domain-containing protein n=1 Tax=Mixia osmundae (strain CBS 9802 / IAM 14324 / JCM 22182 / KY 12970) TaxID=764103 RepID=G7DUG7_MIXOS|nr:uncharacterized protein L969DRAFT_102526 [Mixia osmundae IAM 14324]KEI41100.1 hypothetical protein L969DRAFT_102526 [Mixia osmundae IAM 14324]GAA94227.1 hypothetical protein E5Q_00876 [Mixia osmundae IAM 14324]